MRFSFLYRAALPCVWGLVLATGAQAHEDGQPGHSHQHGAAAAHVHGQAKLDLALDGQRLELALESPLDNLLPFERAPRTPKEREQVQAMAGRFHQGESLVLLAPEAGCRRQETQISSAVLPAALLQAPGAPVPAGAAAGNTAGAAAKPAPAAEGHGDADISLVFQCSRPDLLKAVDLGPLFKAFPRLKQLDAQVVTATGQQGRRLSPKQTRLAW